MTNGSRRRIGFRLGAVAAFLVASVVAPAVTATAQATPEVQLSASTDLVDLQQVAVSGTGFPASTEMVVVQCRAGDPIDVESCDRGVLVVVTTDPAGAFGTEVTVRRTLYLSSGLVDCAVEACAVVASDAAAQSPEAVPVTFDPSVASVLTDPVPEGSCPAPYQPFGYAHWGPEGGSPDLPIAGLAGEALPWRSAGAGLRIQVDGTRALLEVTLDGVVRTFTTEPFPLGTNYPNRTPGPDDAYYQGAVSIVEGADGSTFVAYGRSNSGDYSRFAWRFDEPCDPPVVATAAVAPGVGPSFTG